MKPYNPHVSAQLDWAIFRMEVTRGGRQSFWRAVKWFWEFWT